MSDSQQPDYTTITACRLCGEERLLSLFGLGTQFASDFVAKDKIHSGIKCPLELVLCPGCSLVQLRHTARQDFLYSRHYWYVSSTTQTMRDALHDVVRSARQRVYLGKGDVVLDIGSNNGYLLRCYDREVPGVCKVGVEPAANLAEEGRKRVNVFVSDFWSAEAYRRIRYAYPGDYTICDRCRGQKIDPLDGGPGEGVDCRVCKGTGWDPSSVKRKPLPQAKIITAIGMLYDSTDPNAFIADVAKVLYPDGVFIAQLMCLRNMLNVNDVGNINLEHLSYFSLRSLEYLFGRHGLEVFDMEKNSVNGESYRFYVRHKGSSVGGDPGVSRKFLAHMIEEEKDGLATPEFYHYFFAKMNLNKDRVVAYVKWQAEQGKRVHVLGASSKGSVIMQFYGLDHTLIEAASERSPDKVGLFTSGTGIPIVSEEESRRMNPDLYLCLPWAFKAEILQRERAFLEGGGRLLFPLPSLEVVGREVLA